MGDDREHRVRERAYRIWEDENMPHGQHQDHWHRAERELDEGRNEAEDLSSQIPLQPDALATPANEASGAADTAKPARKSSTRRKKTDQPA